MPAARSSTSGSPPARRRSASSPVARPHRAGHLLGLRLPGGAPEDLAARLAAARVYVSVRGDAVRVAPHVYNDEADVDRLLEVLADAVRGR